LDVNGIWGGYTGEGSKTILPTCASAKISIRLVPNQNPDEILKNTEKYLKSIAPPTVKISLNMAQGGKPVLVRRDSAGVKAAMKAFRLAFNMEPVFMREGGSIPIVELFDSVLHAPTVLMGFGLPSDNIHSPNENYDVENYIGGIKTSAAFFEEFIDFYKK
jgi:acetylornithine deacetylase/succinyl-diaminopimelate desuccinylase-like protein